MFEDGHLLSTLFNEAVAEAMRPDEQSLFHPPPNQVQEEIHLSEAPLTLLIAGNRIGKTFGAMRETLWRALDEHPYRSSEPIERVWAGFPDYQFYLRATLPTFRALCPLSRVLKFHETEKWVRLRRKDGGTAIIYFMSYDSGREKWQGAGVDYIWLDEEVPEDIYREALARTIDRSGDMLLTQTPVSGMGWLYDRLYLPGLSDGVKTRVIQGALAQWDEDAYLNVGEPLVSHLTQSQIVRFAEGIPDEDERAIRIFGSFRARSGTVYKQFRPEVHVVPDFIVPGHWEVWGGVDPGYHGFAVVLMVMAPDGRIYVMEEYFSQQQDTRTRAQAIWDLASPYIHDEEPLLLYVDTEDPQLVLEMNLWADEGAVPLAFASLKQGNKARKAGITRIQGLLMPSPDRPTPWIVKRPRPSQGEPLLYLSDRLRSDWSMEDYTVAGESRLAWELQRYLWKKPPEGSPHPQDADERTAGGAHMLAALRYAIMARMGAPEKIEDDKYETAGSDRWVWEQLDEEEERLVS